MAGLIFFFIVKLWLINIPSLYFMLCYFMLCYVIYQSISTPLYPLKNIKSPLNRYTNSSIIGEKQVTCLFHQPSCKYSLSLFHLKPRRAFMLWAYHFRCLGGGSNGDTHKCIHTCNTNTHMWTHTYKLGLLTHGPPVKMTPNTYSLHSQIRLPSPERN